MIRDVFDLFCCLLNNSTGLTNNLVTCGGDEDDK